MRYIAILGLLGLLVLSYTQLSWWAFEQGYFTYHDLGLINDFLSSYLLGENFFYSFGLQGSHFSYHLTPSLIFTMPFYAVFSSPYQLIFYNILSVATFIGVMSLWVYQSLRSSNPLLWSLLWAVALASNRFFLDIIFSAHYEGLHLGVAAITLFALSQGWKMVYVTVFLLLTIGVRQDIALFMAITCLILPMAPKALFKGERKGLWKRSLFCTLISLSYLLITLTVVTPLFSKGPDIHVTRFYAQWGHSWGEVLFSFLTKPLAVWEALQQSGLPRLIQSFGYLSFVNPLQGVMASAGGILFATASAVDKNQLLYYNSAMLIPGLGLSALAGFFYLKAMVKFPLGGLGLSLLLMVISLENGRSTVREWQNREALIASLDRGVKADVAELVSELKQRKPEARLIAADFYASAFVPVDYGLLRLHQAYLADAVVVTGGSLKLHEFDRGYEEDYFQDHASFRKLAATDAVSLYVRQSLAPSPQTSLAPERKSKASVRDDK